MKVLVCGGRDYKDAATVDHELTMLWPDEIIEGGANGADKLAREWAQRNNCPCQTFPADWQQHGKAAGPIRNRQMLTEGRPDLVLAFPGGRGTEDMITCAKAKGITVRDMRCTKPSS